jgi:parallel beta-helix repeat protein
MPHRANLCQPDRHSSIVVPVITLNEVTNNIGRGLYVESSGSATVVHNTITGNGGDGLYLNDAGVANINYNNIADNSGSYELYNYSASAVDARYNWWGGSPTAQMDVGGNPKNITKVYDIYDDGTKGGVDYSQWLSETLALVTDPISWVKDPEDNTTIKAASYTIRGAASALAGIDRVEVSTDNGLTWDFATGTADWSYEWSIPGDGTYTIQSRVIANDGQVGAASEQISVTVDRTVTTVAGTI